MTALEFAIVGNASLALEAARLVLGRGHKLCSFTTTDLALMRMAQGMGLPVGPVSTCDYLLSVANLRVIPQRELDLARRGAVNFHDGPLPERAGLNAPVWALIEGATDHTITWHRIAGGVDEGPVLLREPVAIEADDTALTLNARCWEAAQRSLPRLLDLLEAGADQGNPQPHAPLRRHMRDDRPALAGLLDPAAGADVLARLVLALDHGPYWNPLLRARIMLGGRPVLVSGAEIIAQPAGAGAGTVLEVSGDSVVIACGDGRALRLTGLMRPNGTTLDPVARIGEVVPSPRPDDMLEQAVRHAARDEAHWRDRLAAMAPLVLPETIVTDAVPDWSPADPELNLPIAAASVMAALAAAVARMNGSTSFDIALSPPLAASVRPHMLGFQPVRVDIDDQSLGGLADALTRDIHAAWTRGPIMADLLVRAPELSNPGTPGLALAATPDDAPADAVICVIAADPAQPGPHVLWNRARLPAATWAAIAAIARTFASLDADTPILQAPTLAPDHTGHVVRNDLPLPADTPTTIHQAFAASVAAHPDATALVFRDRTLSYAQLDELAGRLARKLAAMGVGPGDPVGLFAPRGLGLVVGALAILKAGAAYVPLDPAYPAERLEHYIADSGAGVVLADPAIVAQLPRHDARVLTLDGDGPEAEPRPASGSDLAYVIYTSGSTGLPKGVMVEHHNVINFFAGMDEAFGHPVPQTWLAVTSLSFDISVLEIFWTMTRGWKVVIAGDVLGHDGGGAGGDLFGDARRVGMAMSLYYWGNDDAAGGRKYELLLEGARIADRNGFVAVWTPERHFHAFGGPYPNPSVTGAAVAAITERIGVRAGSCVAPLHHPARIAEEWAVIDNLTKGRAGIAFASGWQPDDFVLRPENTPPANKPAMIETLEQVRRLWRGEAVGFPRADGNLHEVVTQPRPVSAELPVWITTAGNPATWREAGRLGANVLTHLLGQSIDDISARIPEYHAALREAGHDPADFSVTLMLHTFLADTRQAAMETAREPMKDYLRAATALVKQYAWAFPAFKKPAGVSDPMALDLASLTEDELEGILDFAFLRYFNDSGLFGTVEDGVARIAELKAKGISEIACLIDYGIPSNRVLDGLRHLVELHDRVNPVLTDDTDFSIAAQIRRHGVTHMQSTPSLARLLLEDADPREALGQLDMYALGGEALNPGLLAELRSVGRVRVVNLYGPTETTIWSTAADLGREGDAVRLGEPIANTILELRDPAGHPVADGVAGELWIGGNGLTRGYLNRPEQTAAAFRDYPEGRRYRTGDLCRRDSTGRLCFLGRVDQQVKLRGYRIELGEIEARLARLPGVQEAAVVARPDDAGENQLIGFVTGDDGLTTDWLRQALSRDLPDFMVPLHIHRLPAMPLTPNRKIDRKALTEQASAPHPARAPQPVAVAQPVATAQPVAAGRAAGGATPDAAALEDRIGRLMARILGLPVVGPSDSFFALGGHSLLAVQLHRAIRDELGGVRSSVTDIFRFPVLRDLAAHLARQATPITLGAALPPLSLTAEPAAPVAAQPARARDLMAERRALRARLRGQDAGP